MLASGVQYVGISNSTVNATAEPCHCGGNSAGIGAGSSFSNVENVTISNSNVSASPAGPRVSTDSAEICSLNQHFSSFFGVTDGSRLVVFSSNRSTKIESDRHGGVILPDGNWLLCLSELKSNQCFQIDSLRLANALNAAGERGSAEVENAKTGDAEWNF
jgi:hypothetical protein